MNNITYKTTSVVSRTGGIIKKLVTGERAANNYAGEIYSLQLIANEIKAWRRHTQRVCNFHVLSGEILFELKADSGISSYLLSEKTFDSLIIFPGIAFRFTNMKSESAILLNILDGIHSESEVEFV